MTAVKFCDPCQALLRGERTEDGGEHLEFEIRYVHHDTAESFRLALELPCAICIRLWAAITRLRKNTMSEESFQAQFLPAGPTTISAMTEVTTDNTVVSDCFNYQCDLIWFKIRPEPEPPGHLVAPFSKNTGDDIALRFLRIQYQRCLQDHAACQYQRKDHDFLPTRLIDVGDTADLLVRLREHISPTARVRYVALSHCWGAFQPATLTKSTADLLRNGIAVASLPKTFQDAIVVTRSMSCKFLWIDSLCIQQDNSDDWATESAVMREVYSNAVFCIAAVAAMNAKIGLFFDRDMELMTQVRVEFSRAMDVYNEFALNQLCGSYWLSFEKHSRSSSIDAAPLNQRAWVAQERFLSRRIMHFANDILFWECQESFTSETHPNGHPDRYDDSIGSRALKTWFDRYERRRVANGDSAVEKHTELQSSDMLYSKWRQFLQFYTSCKLTVGADVLVALDGVSREIATTLQDEMIAGLWKRRMLSELCWRIFETKPCRPPFRTAPSWSWASTTSSISFDDQRGSWSSMAKVEQAYVDLSPSGALKHASLILRCHLIPINLECTRDEYLPWLNHTTKLAPCAVRTTLDDKAYWDFAGLHEDFGTYALLLQHNSSLDSGRCRAKGIIVRPAPGYAPGSYKRIGFCNMWYYTGPGHSTTESEIIQECAELQTISLF